MAAKRDAAAELAGKMVQVLHAQRRRGTDSYPLRLRRLAELTDYAVPEELILKTVKRKPLSDQAIIVGPKELSSPVALAEDADQLADSSLLLEYVLSLVCTPGKPACGVAQLKAKVPLKLRRLFEAALSRRIEDNRMPNGVAVVTQKKKPLFHLTRHPLPQPPHVVLAEGMVTVLRSVRERGGEAYPLTFDKLLELTAVGADPKLVKKTVREPVFQQSVLVAMKNQPESPVALAEDIERLAGSSLLLEMALRRERTDANQVCSLADLKKKVVPILKKPMEEAVCRRIEAKELSPAVGCLRDKRKKYVLFLMSDVLTARSGPTEVGRSARAHVGEFGRAFDRAFQRLDRQGGSHNAVSLVELRRLLPLDRPVFDAELGNLRRAGRYTLSAAEGRHGIRPEEQEAGIVEDGTLLLYVSRKLS